MRDVRTDRGAELALPLHLRLRRAGFLALFLALASLARLALASPACWTSVPPMPTPRYTLAAASIGTTIFAIGGYGGSYLGIVEAYDSPTGVWSTRAAMPTPRNNPAVGAINGLLYAAGGGVSGLPEDALEIYDPALNTWSTAATMPTPRYSPGGAVVGGTLYVVGGEDNSSFLGTLEAYDPATNSWTALAAMPTARTEFAVGVIAGKIYAAGGWNGSSLNTLEVYDPASNSWTTKASMPTARSGLAVAVVGGTLYAIGGEYGASLTTVEAYDPATDSWTTLCGLQTGRSYPAAVTVGATLYAVGGWNNGYLSSMESVAYRDLPMVPNLVTTIAVSNPTPHAGDTVTVTITVRNAGLAGAAVVSPSLSIAGDQGLLSLVSAPPSTGTTLLPGDSLSAVWSYRLTSNGHATFTGSATGRDVVTHQPVGSPPASIMIMSPPVRESPVVITGGTTGPVNPSQGEHVTVAFWDTAGGATRITFMTYGGRVIYSMLVTTRANAWNRLTWDLRNARDRFIAPGVYGVVIRGPGIRGRTSFVAGR